MIQVVYAIADHVKATTVAAFVKAKWPDAAVEIALTIDRPLHHIECSSEERIDPYTVEGAFVAEIGGSL